MSDGGDQANTEARMAGPGPGERLQAARIQQGLSLEDVAHRMHLSPGILEAIEENNFEEITAPIFVKGYLRAYARIVSLDEDEMIDQYAKYYSGEDPPISSVSNVAPELSAADARVKGMTLLVVVVIAALLVAWWWNRQQDVEAPISLDAQAPATETMAPEPPAEETARISQEPAAASDSAEVVVTNGAPANESAAVEPEPEPVEVAAAPLAETEVEVETATTEAPAEPGAEPVIDSDAATGETAQADTRVEGPVRSEMAPSGNDRLEIIVHADTWADIKDDSDYQLVYDLLRADRQMELTGQAPFAVFLGNGHGVELRLNGEPVDFSGRIRDDNTVRLQVGG